MENSNRCTNNYTLVREQYIITGTWSGTHRPIDCELVHEIFDIAEAERMERRGYSGIGAGARVVIVNDDGDEMEVKSPAEAIEVLGNIEQGSRMRAFKFRARRSRRAVWNDNSPHSRPTLRIGLNRQPLSVVRGRSGNRAILEVDYEQIHNKHLQAV